MGIKISDLDSATPGDLDDASIIAAVVGPAGTESTKGAALGDVSDTVITNLATGSSSVATEMRTTLSDTVITNLVTGTSTIAAAAMVNLSTSVAANMGSGIVTQTNADIVAGATSVFVNDPGAFTEGGSITVGGETRTILTIDPATGEITFADPLTNACSQPCPVGNPAAGMSGAGITAGTITAGSLAADGTAGSIASPTGGLTLTPQGLAVNPTPASVKIYINATGVDYVNGTSHQTISTITHGPTERFTSFTHAFNWAEDNIGSSTVQCTMILESDVTEPAYTYHVKRTMEGRFGTIIWTTDRHESALLGVTLPDDSTLRTVTMPKQSGTIYNRVPLWFEHDMMIIRGIHMIFPGGDDNSEYCLIRSIAGRIQLSECKVTLGVCTAGGTWEERRLSQVFEAVESGSIRIARAMPHNHHDWNWLQKTTGSAIDKKQSNLEIDCTARPINIMFQAAQNSKIELGVEFAPGQDVHIPNGGTPLQHTGHYARIHFAGDALDCNELIRCDVSSFVNMNSLPTVSTTMTTIAAAGCVIRGLSFSTVSFGLTPNQVTWNAAGATLATYADYDYPRWPAGKGFHADSVDVADVDGRDNISTYLSTNIGFHDGDTPPTGSNPSYAQRSLVSTDKADLLQVEDYY